MKTPSVDGLCYYLLHIIIKGKCYVKLNWWKICRRIKIVCFPLDAYKEICINIFVEHTNS